MNEGQHANDKRSTIGTQSYAIETEGKAHIGRERMKCLDMVKAAACVLETLTMQGRPI